MAGVAIGMAVLALFVGLGAVVMLHLVKGLLLEVRDQLKVLQVAVYGVEASVLPEVRQTRESADAGTAVAAELRALVEEVVMSPKARADRRPLFDPSAPFGRVMAAREMFATAETASLDEMLRRDEVTRNG